MPAVFVNTATVLVGSLIGIFFRSRLRERMQRALMTALALCTLLIGIMSAVKTENILCCIICMALGTALGEVLHIDDGIEKLGDRLKARFAKNEGAHSRFTEGFVSACILFCIGSMTIVGSLRAGIEHDYSIIFAKSTLDLVSSMAMAAAMGIGVMFAAGFVLVFQGALTLLATWVGAVLSTAVITEMSAVGGIVLLGMGINMLELGRERIRVSNMLPAIFLPILYLPIEKLLGGLF